MSADHQALLDALRDDVKDDAALLVYADWLEEHGDPERAEYIRVRHTLHPMAGDDPRFPELFLRGDRLWRRNSKRWSRGLPHYAVGSLRYGGVARVVICTAAAFLKGADALREQALSLVTLTAAGKKLQAVADCPALAGVRELAIQDTHVAVKDLAALVASPHLGKLHTLRLKLTRLQPAAGEVLAEAPLLGRLRTLDLGFCEPSDFTLRNHLRERATAVHSGHLNALGDAGLEALAGSPRLAGVETLILANNGIGAEGLRRLAGSPHAAGLRRLDLSFNRLGPEAVGDLAGSPLMARLEELEIQASGHADEGACALARATAAKNLKRLDLSGSYRDSSPLLYDVTARELARSPHLAGLEHLLLFRNSIGADGVRALLQSEHLTSLRTLSLGRNPVGDEGARLLAASDRLARLTTLDLRECGITGEGAMAFLRSKKVTAQLFLDLTENPLDEAAVAALRDRRGFRVVVPNPEPVL